MTILIIVIIIVVEINQVPKRYHEKYVYIFDRVKL